MVTIPGAFDSHRGHLTAAEDCSLGAGRYIAFMKRTVRWRSYCEQLGHDLDDIESLMLELLDHSTILNVDPNRGQSDVFFVGAAIWGWARSDDVQTRLQMRGVERYGEWFSRFRLLFRTPTPEVRRRIKHGDEFARRWFERGHNDHSIPRDIPTAKATAQKEFEGLRSLLAIACSDAAAPPALIAVPDTNALIDNPDLASYGQRLGQTEYQVRLVPTVLGELDELKRSGRTEQARDGARRADRMLKGLRDRGDVRSGVPVTKSVSAIFDVAEPRFDDLPAWLDPTVPDDRLVASALLLQASDPSTAVVLVTSDLNLQNKAAAVGLPHIEPPTP